MVTFMTRTTAVRRAGMPELTKPDAEDHSSILINYECGLHTSEFQQIKVHGFYKSVTVYNQKVMHLIKRK